MPENITLLHTCVEQCCVCHIVFLVNWQLSLDITLCCGRRANPPLDVPTQQPPTTASQQQETHVYTQSSETLKAHANVLKVGSWPDAVCPIGWTLT